MLISLPCAWPVIPTLLIGALLLGGCDSEHSPVDREQEPANQASFSFVLEITEEGVTATCERGCDWINVSARYPDGRYCIS